MRTKLYQVGGHVRDKFLGVNSKDIDYAVEANSFDRMRDAIINRKGHIYLETPEYVTIRAHVPRIGAADFVLCHIPSGHKGNRHSKGIKIGTIEEDLSRRDFTMNAIAIDEHGKVFDPYDGKRDIERRLIRCVGSAEDRFSEDALRMVRALRFHVTKQMDLDKEIIKCLERRSLLELLEFVAIDRIREELNKCFRHNTIATLCALNKFKRLAFKVFKRDQLWLKPTTEQK